MSVVLIVAPHPDDETLACAGALLKHKKAGDEIHWLIMTGVKSTTKTRRVVQRRNREITLVAKAFCFSSVSKLGFSPASLDSVPRDQIIQRISAVIAKIKPEILYLPFWGDIHSDHYYTFEAASACTKTFRYPCIKKIRVYETLSETDLVIRPDRHFIPNLWVDVSEFIDQKLSILDIYRSELGVHPFPRSLENVKALAVHRGATVNVCAAEAFMSLKEIA